MPDLLKLVDSRKKKLFALIIFLFVVLRFFLLADYRPVWIDEQASINAACGDSTLQFYTPEQLHQILEKNKNEGHLIGKIFEANLQNDRSNALVFDYVLSAWIQLFGTKPVACRSISLLFFLLCLPLILLLGKRELNSVTFLLLLVLSNSLLFRYNFECRTYMFTSFLSLLSTRMLLKYMNSQRKLHLLFYFSILVLSLFSHYLVLVVFIWHFYLLMRNSQNSQKIQLLFSYLLCSGLLVFGFYLLNLETAFIERLMAASSNIAKHAATSVHFKPATPSNILTGLAQVLSQNFNLSLQSVLRIRNFAVLMILPAALTYFRIIKSPGSDSSIYTPVILIHVLYLLCISLLSKSTTIFQLCYSIFVLPYYLIMLAKLTQGPITEHPKVLIAAKLLILLIGLGDTAGYIFLS